jgi:hypothetical protein
MNCVPVIGPLYDHPAVIVVPLLAAVKFVGAYRVVNELAVVIVDIPKLF